MLFKQCQRTDFERRAVLKAVIRIKILAMFLIIFKMYVSLIKGFVFRKGMAFKSMAMVAKTMQHFKDAP